MQRRVSVLRHAAALSQTHPLSAQVRAHPPTLATHCLTKPREGQARDEARQLAFRQTTMPRKDGCGWHSFVVMARVWEDFFLFLRLQKSTRRCVNFLNPPHTRDPLHHTCIGVQKKTERDQVRFPPIFRPGAIHRSQPHITGPNKTSNTRNAQCLPWPRRSPSRSPRCLRNPRVASAPPPPFRLLQLPPVLRPAASRRPARHMERGSQRESMLSARKSSGSCSGAEGSWPAARSSAQSGISGLCAEGTWPAALSRDLSHERPSGSCSGAQGSWP